MGNDVVDLKTPGAKGKSTDARFMNKVLTPDERRAVLHARDPDRCLWAFWASKECAYKAVSKSSPDVTTSLKRYSVSLTSKPLSVLSTGIVNTPRGIVGVRLFLHEQVVHCFGTYNCSPGLNNIIWGLEKILPDNSAADSLPPARQSLIVRQIACQSIAALLKLETAKIQIKRQKGHRGLGPPIVYHRGNRMEIDISLSHHGRYGAYVFWIPYSLINYYKTITDINRSRFFFRLKRGRLSVKH